MLIAFIGLSMRAFGGAQESVPRRRMNVCHLAMREGVKGNREMERDGRMRGTGGEGGVRYAHSLARSARCGAIS